MYLDLRVCFLPFQIVEANDHAVILRNVNIKWNDIVLSSLCVRRIRTYQFLNNNAGRLLNNTSFIVKLRK